MSHFMSEKQYDELVAAVKEDIRRHRESGVDLNPYSTAGLRGSWQRGFNGEPEMLLDYDMPRQRGILAAQMIKMEGV